MSKLCSNSDMRHISLAIKEAYKSTERFRHGCIAVASGKVVAKGFNYHRTYSNDGLIGRNCSCHAEIDVLRKCLKQNITKKMNLYVTRISPDNSVRNSRPCFHCYDKMQLFNIKHIIYSDANGDFIKEPLGDFTPTHLASGSRAMITNRTY